jgi:hypothetical protein
MITYRGEKIQPGSKRSMNSKERNITMLRSLLMISSERRFGEISRGLPK